MKKFYSYPVYYDVLFGWDRSQEVLFVDQLAQTYNLEGQKFLEMACGTGTVSRQLSFLGWEVHGLDLSKEMVQEMNQQMKTVEDKVWAYEGDMANFKIPKSFDLIYNALGSIGLMSNEQDFISHFKCVKEHLNKSGVYVVDVGLQKSSTVKTQICNLNEMVWAMEVEGIYVEASEGKVKVEDDMKALKLELDWDAVPLEFNKNHFEEIVKKSGLMIDELFCQAGVTEEGIPSFDIDQKGYKVGADRAMYVLKA